MRLYKRGEYWWASWTQDGVTIRKSTHCATRSSADLVAKRWERQRADPDHARQEAATFAGAVEGFLEDLKRRDAPSATQGFYTQKTGTLLRFFKSDVSINDAVTVETVDRYLKERSAEPVAWDDAGQPTRCVTASCIHKELVALRQVLKRAYRRGEYKHEPTKILPVGFSPKYKPRTTALTMEQAAALLVELGPHRAAVVAFILATTARRKEAFAALRADANAKTGKVFLPGTKTAGAARTVTVQRFALPVLAFAIQHGTGTEGRLFAPWPSMRRDILAACRRAGVPAVTANDLRRTLATWLIEAGASNYLVSKVLGHASTVMVDKVYGKPREDAVAHLIGEHTRQLPELQVAALPAGNAGGSTVPTVYQPGADQDRIQPTVAELVAAKAAKLVGREGFEPSADGLKGRTPTDLTVENDRDEVRGSMPAVPLVYQEAMRRALAAVHGDGRALALLLGCIP